MVTSVKLRDEAKSEHVSAEADPLLTASPTNARLDNNGSLEPFTAFPPTPRFKAGVVNHIVSRSERVPTMRLTLTPITRQPGNRSVQRIAPDCGIGMTTRWNAAVSPSHCCRM